MPSTNSTVSQLLDLCPDFGPYQWRNEYIAPVMYKHYVIVSVINGLSFPFTAIFNAAFILYIILKPNLRKEKPTVLMGYLAVTDLAVGVIIQPIFLASKLYRITGQWRTCALDTAFFYLSGICCGSSVLRVTLIAWERYIAVKHALQYRLIVTTKKLLAGTIAAWLLVITLSCTIFLCARPYIYRQVFSIVFLICFSTTVYFYVVIYLESRRHRHEITVTNVSHQGTNRSREKGFRAAKTTARIFGCLLVCYGPAVAVSINTIFISLPVNQSEISVRLCIFSWVQTLIMLNSLCNPFIYGWRVQEISDFIASIFKCCSASGSPEPEPEPEMIEVIAIIRNRLNLGDDEELTNGSFSSGQNSQWNQKLTTETCIESSAGASEQHGCVCKVKLTPRNSPTDHLKTANPKQNSSNIRDDGDSASDFELNEPSWKGKASKKEENKITVTAMVHWSPMPNLEEPEAVDEVGDISSDTIKIDRSETAKTETGAR